MKTLIVQSCSGFQFSTDLEDSDEIERIQIQKPEAASSSCLRNNKARYSTDLKQYLKGRIVRIVLLTYYVLCSQSGQKDKTLL